MALPDIYAAFQAAARDGRLAGDLPPGLGALLRSLNVGELTVTGGEPFLGPDSAWLTGTTAFLNTSWAMTLTGRDGGNPAHPERAALVLELSVSGQTASWTFGQAFPGVDVLPETRRVTAESNGTLVLAPSVVAPLVLLAPVLTAANDPMSDDLVLPRLQGSLPLDGRPDAPGSDVLAHYATFLGTPLFADGTVDLADPLHPKIELPAAAPGAALTLADLTVSQVGIHLTTTYPDPSFIPEEGAPRSAALLYAEVVLPTSPPDTVSISGPLLTGDNVWPLQIRFEDPLTLAGGIQALLAMAGVPDAKDFDLPTGIAPIDMFGLSDLGFGVLPPAKGGPKLRFAAIGVKSTKPWDPPVPFLTIEEVGTRWSFAFSPRRKPLVTGTVFGTMRFGAKKVSSLGAAAPYAVRLARGEVAAPQSDIVVTVQLSLPDYGFTAFTEEPFDLPIGEAVKVLIGADAPALDLRVESLNVNASLTRKELAAALTVTGPWDLSAGLVHLALTGLELQAYYSQSQVSGRIQGSARLEVPDSDPVELFAAAEYPGKGVWVVEAGLVGTVDLPRLAYALVGVEPPQWVKDMAIELADLYLRYSTADGSPFTARGTLRVRVGERLLGVDMRIELTAEIERRVRGSTTAELLAAALDGTPHVEPGTVTTGSLSGTFAVNRFSVTASVSVTDANKDYTFAVRYRDAALTGATSWLTTGGPRRQILTLRLSGTLGSVVEYLVSLANPNANYRLDPPWDFLNTISLNGFALVLDPVMSSVSVTYDVKLDLGFVNIKSVGLRYDRSSGSPAVNFELVVQMLGDTAPKPVAWDAVNQSPPAVPGKGQSLFDLRYLGLGQHVTPKGLTSYTSITDVVDALVKAMRPITDPRKNPIDPATMQFDPSSQWLFGIDATVMDTVSVKLVMHDPDLYGVVVALSGPAAKSLAGLNVELLYKKVTNDIGVFHARLQIPDAFRQLQLGAAAVTLGIITVDIYTNGNFRIDLGFPHNGDFSVSFAVEAGVFNGRGGIYFGLLNGATSSRVPAITNGTFSPVIELGVGLSVGVGRTFEKGPLSAGLYVNLVVIFEGALAWYHPDDGNGGTELYYWCRGTAGIVGKVYGSVDFKVIAVSVSIEISAMATLEMAAYKATLVELNLTVRANASVKIVFFRISFSFSLTVSASFVIGSDSTPPWRLAQGQSGRARGAARPLGAGLAAVQEGYRMRFDKDAVVFPDGVAHTVHLTLVPAYTVAGVPVSWDGTQPPNDAPEYRLVLMLVADNAVPAGAVTIADTHRPDVSRNARAATAADTSFNQAVEGLLRWSLNALGVTSPTAVVTRAQLEDLVAQLAMVEAANTGFTWENVEGFLRKNLNLVVTGTPAGLAASDPDLGGTPFPMPPVLEWTSPDLPDPDQRTRKFWEHQQVDATYEAEALAYFDKLDPRPPADRPAAAARLAAGADDPTESMATFVLRDYARLVARTAAQAAVDLLAAYPHPVAATDSLDHIAGLFPTATVAYEVVPGDSVEHVAEALGLSSAELLALNPGIAAALAAAAPGDVLHVAVGVTPQSIAVANPSWPVVAGRTVHLGTVDVQVPAGATLASLARTYGADVATWLPALLDRTPLLREGATVALPGFVYANPTGKTVDEAAAVFYVRLGRALAVDVPLADWYAQAIYRLNPGVTGDEPLPASLTVPDGYQAVATSPWTTVGGDTVEDVAAYLALLQNVVAGSAYERWRAQVRDANPTPPAPGVALPAGTTATVLGGDTLASLRDRLLLAGQDAAFRGYVEGADVLVPLVSVPVPDATVTTAAGLTLLTLAQAYGLSLEDLAGRMAADAGVLATDDKNDLVVPDVAAMPLEQLTEALHGGRPMATISGQVARFMLYGLRLPAPEYDGHVYRATGAMTGVYELIGQQVTGPAPVTPVPDPDPPVVTITVGKGQPADWLTFAAPLVADGRVEPGGAATEAVVSIDDADLLAGYPATGLAPVVLSAPAALPAWHDLAVRYAVSQVIPWQTTDRPVLPVEPPATALPTLWPLPADLMARAAGGASTSRFLLEQTVPQAGPSAPFTELGSYAWATLVRFGVRRVPGLPGTVEVLGAGTAERQRLALLLDYLGAIAERPAAFPAPPAGERARLRLLWQLPPTPGMAPGLTSVPLVSDATFIVQTNLSTETHSGVTRTDAPGTEPTAGTHFASIADAERFLTLLWECSVVGGGGYWMQYRGTGAGVPDSIFDQDGLAQLALLVQLDSQSTTDPDVSWPVRTLFAFNDCAVVGDGVDAKSVALSARAADPAELRRGASLDPGQAGFAAELANATDATTPAGRAAQLYSLLGYQLLPAPPFGGSEEGRPVGPEPRRTRDDLGLLRLAEEDEQVWSLSRVVDLSRFAASPLPAVPTAPPPDADPYAGTGEDAEVALWFQDVFGNASAKPVAGDPGVVPLPARYTDPVLGAGSWPSTTTSFAVEPAGAQARLVVAADLQAIAYQPGASEPGDAVTAKAARDRDRLAAVYYQVMQPDVHASLLTSLQQAPGADPAALPVDVDVLRRYVVGSHALLGTLALLLPRPADATAAPALDDVCTRYGVSYDALAAANADADLSAMLGATAVAVPVTAAFRNGDTVAALCRALDPAPNPVTVLQDEDNVVLPLMPGTEIALPPRDAVVPPESPAVVDLVAQIGCTLPTLVAANATRPGLLAPGFVFECNGVKVGVAPEPPESETTLALVAQTFQQHGVPLDAAQVVALNADVPGVFRPGATLVVDGYVVRSGDTLAANHAHATPADLAPLNVATVDLFPPGTPLFLTTRQADVPAGETLARFAAVQGTAPGALLRHNGSATVSVTAPPVVPGAWAWPAVTDGLRVPYTVRAHDRLADVAARFGTAALALATVDGTMPGTVAAGVRIEVDGKSVTTAAPASFAEVCALFDPPVDLAALVPAIAARDDVLATGALLACPPGVLPSTPSTGLGGLTPADAAAPFGVTGAALLAANAGTPGLLLAGQVLASYAASDAPTETVAADDTLTALVDRFRRAGVTTSVDALVAANAKAGFLRTGARVLVPPASATVSALVGTPEGAWTFPAPVFPVHVTLEVARDPVLVDPALADTATRDRTAVPATRGADASQGGALSLAAFAEQVEAAVPVLRLATGQVLSDVATDVWAVVFGAGAVAKVRVSPPLTVPGVTGRQPRTFALRPLANTLIARQDVVTQEFDVATGSLGKEVKRNYQGIDLEVWARSFLSDVELMLSAAYVRGAYALNRTALDEIAGAKRTLAGAIANSLDYVLAGETGDPARAAAAETLRQQLLVSLPRGYDTSAVLQYDTDVTSPWATPYARLSGNPVTTFASTDERLKTASVSNAKVPLAQGTSRVSFLVTVPDVQSHAALGLHLDYRVVELEFGITPQVEGYESSDWLTFLTPLGNGSPEALAIDLGSPVVPLPLRAYPPMPMLLDHAAEVPTEAATLADAVHWRYRCSLRHQSAEQDSVAFTVTFNQQPAAGLDVGGPDDLFAALAQYSVAATPMLGLLAGLVDWEKATPEQRSVLHAAIGTFRDLAVKVASAWTSHWDHVPRTATVDAAAIGTGPAQDVYDYAMRLDADESASWYTTLTLTRKKVGGPGTVGWPDIVAVTAGGDRHPLTPAAPEACGCGDADTCACYAFPVEPGDRVPAFSLVTFELTFPPVHVASYQNATARVWVTRNERLLGDAGPDTTPDFVYRTPDVSYPQPVVPFIDITGAIPIGGWPSAPLGPAFATVFDGHAADRTVGIGVRYAYTLVPGDPPVEALLPVLQSTVGDYESTTVGAVTAYVDQWRRDNDPATDGGAWAFWVSLYSSLDPSLQRPVLQLKRLSSPLA